MYILDFKFKVKKFRPNVQQKPFANELYVCVCVYYYEPEESLC